MFAKQLLTYLNDDFFLHVTEPFYDSNQIVFYHMFFHLSAKKIGFVFTNIIFKNNDFFQFSKALYVNNDAIPYYFVNSHYCVIVNYTWLMHSLIDFIPTCRVNFVFILFLYTVYLLNFTHQIKDFSSFLTYKTYDKNL